MGCYFATLGPSRGAVPTASTSLWTPSLVANTSRALATSDDSLKVTATESDAMAHWTDEQ
jgi:hypothetical protein